MPQAAGLLLGSSLDKSYYNKVNLLITTASLVLVNKAPNIGPDSSLFYRDTGLMQDRSI